MVALAETTRYKNRLRTHTSQSASPPASEQAVLSSTHAPSRMGKPAEAVGPEPAKKVGSVLVYSTFFGQNYLASQNLTKCAFFVLGIKYLCLE